MSSVKLNASLVNGLEPRSKDYQVYDAEVPGLLVKVTPKGKKVYYLWYRTRDQIARKIKLGDHGIITPHQARDKARQLLNAIASGADPSRELAEAKTAPTVADSAERFKEYVAAHNKPSTAKEYGRVIDRWIVPKWGSMKLAALRLADVDGLHSQLKTTPYEANRMLAVVSSMLSRAITAKDLPKGSNFCSDIKRYVEHRRGTILTTDQMGKLGQALRAMAADEARRPVAYVLLLLLFTGCRKGEVRTLEWEFIDLENRVIRFPDSKNGQKVHMLGSAAVALFSTVARINGSPFVFPSTNDPQRPITDSTVSHAWDNIRKAIGLNKVRVHDLRHNRGSWGAKNQFGGFTLQQMLGHKNMVTTQRYLHAFDETLADANDTLDAQFVEAMGMTGGEVIPFPVKDKGA